MSKRNPIKRNFIEAAMRSHSIVLFFVLMLVAFGFWSLPHLRKNEFPSVTILQGVVAVIYPGATAEEIEVQVTRPVEDHLFTFGEVNKQDTYSLTKDGMLLVFVTLNNDTQLPGLVWSRIRESLMLFRISSLPQGVLATAVLDNINDASSLLIAIESTERTPHELHDIANQLGQHLRQIPELGNIQIAGKQAEEIAIMVDPIKLSQYGISPSFISAELTAQGFRTITGTANNNDGSAMIHVAIPYGNEYDISQMVVFADPVTKQTIRLRDVAKIQRRYRQQDSYIAYRDEDTPDNLCLIMSVTMHPGNNVVDFGKQVDKQMKKFQQTCPPDVHFHRIVDQPRVVNKAVLSFLNDLLEAVLIVIIVMLLLFPIRTALVSSTSVPVCIASTFAVMYLCGIELNTVSLAALIVVLGMIVDDSVVVIDGYTEKLSQGHSRWYSAAVSTRQLVSSMAIATCSISLMFFPMIFIIEGQLHDFIRMFPWMLFVALTCSLIYAIWVIPYLSARMIKPRKNEQPSRFERIQNTFFNGLLGMYERLLKWCFAHRYATVGISAGLVVIGTIIFLNLDMQILPKAERDMFAVEVLLESGSSLEETSLVADSLATLLTADPRVVSVTRFVGAMPPRFHFAYAPQMARSELAQFIVTTQSNQATNQLMDSLQLKYENYFPTAQIRMRQMDYQVGLAPIEVILTGPDYESMTPVVDSILGFYHKIDGFCYIHTNYDDVQEMVEVVLNSDEANRLGVSQAQLSLMMKSVLSGTQMVSVWEGDYNLPITFYTEGVQDISYAALGDLLVPTALPGTYVPLRQIAELRPTFHHTILPHNNGIRSISVSTDLLPGYSQTVEWKKVEAYLKTLDMPAGVEWQQGGAVGRTARQMPGLYKSIAAAILVMFLILVFHYGRLGISVLSISMSVICIFGAGLGLWVFDQKVSITALLGLISLISINVRNAIIMYDYAIEIRAQKGLTITEAAYEAGLRRMRPIFLTSMTTALGVIPMIIQHSLLWMPMGVVICFGTLFTLPLVVTLMPVAYSLAFDKAPQQEKGGTK